MTDIFGYNLDSEYERMMESFRTKGRRADRFSNEDYLKMKKDLEKA